MYLSLRQRGTFFYCDPAYFASTPYWRGVPKFTAQDHEDLAKILGNTQGKWLLTYNGHPHIRRLYVGFTMVPVSTKLNTDKITQTNRRSLAQLIIRNYESPKESVVTRVNNSIDVLTHVMASG